MEGRLPVGGGRDVSGVDVVLRTIIVGAMNVVTMCDLIVDGPYRPAHIGWLVVTTWLLYSSRLVCHVSLRPLH